MIDYATLLELEVPYQRLWTAVLRVAVTDYQSAVRKGNKSTINSIKNWVLDPRDTEGSYLWACSVVKLNPSYLIDEVNAPVPLGLRNSR